MKKIHSVLSIVVVSCLMTGLTVTASGAGAVQTVFYEEKAGQRAESVEETNGPIRHDGYYGKYKGVYWSSEGRVFTVSTKNRLLAEAPDPSDPNAWKDNYFLSVSHYPDPYSSDGREIYQSLVFSKTEDKSIWELHFSDVEEIVVSEGVTTLPSGLLVGLSHAETVTLPTSLKTIEADVFKDCTALRTVNYNGTEEQWNAIKIAGGNETLIAAKAHETTGEETGESSEGGTADTPSDSSPDSSPDSLPDEQPDTSEETQPPVEETSAWDWLNHCPLISFLRGLFGISSL